MYKIKGTFDTTGESINECYDKAIRDPNRKMDIRIGDPADDIGFNTIDDTKISDLSISYSLTEDSDFEFGIFSCASVSLTLRHDIPLWENGKFTVYSTLKVPDSLGIEHDVEVRIGTFYANEINKDSVSKSVKAYDIAYFYGQYNLRKSDLDERLKNDGEADYLLVSDLVYCMNNNNYTTKLKIMYGPKYDLVDSSKIRPSTLNSKVYLDTESLSKLTFRQIIGYIAGFSGEYARINKEGFLEFFSINDTKQEYDWDVFGGFRKYDYKMELDRLECVSNVQGFEDVTISSQGGTNVYKFENPLITSESELNAILDNSDNMIKGLSYYQCELKLKGDPRLEIGDFITVQTRESSICNDFCGDVQTVPRIVPLKVLIMDMTMRLNKGCMLDIKSVTDKDRKREFYVGGTLSDQLKYLKSQLEKVESGNSGAISDVKKEVEDSRGDYPTLGDNLNHMNELISDKVSTGTLTSNYIKADEIEAKYVKTEKLEAEYIKTDEIEANYAKIDTLEANYAKIDRLEANEAKINELDANKANINELNAVEANIINLIADSATIDQLKANHATIHDLVATKADIDTLNAVNVTVNGLKADIAEIDKAYVKNAEIDNLIANNATIKQLDANVINVKEELNATNANITNLKTEVIDTARLNAETIVTEKLEAFEIDADKIQAGSITADKLDANSIKTDILDSYEIDASKITSGFISSDLIQAGSITSDKISANILDSEHIMAGSIDSINIAANAIDADRIQAGTITTEHISAGGLRADVITSGKISSKFISTKDLVAENITAGALKSAWGQFTDGSLGSAAIGSIDAGKIVVDSLFANKVIDASVITADKIKSGVLNLSEGLTIGNPLLKVPGSPGGILMEDRRITIREPYSENTVANPIDQGNIRVQIGQYSDSINGAVENNYGLLVMGYKRDDNGNLEFNDDGTPIYDWIFDSDRGLNTEMGLQSKSIGTAKIKDNAITTDKIESGAITDDLINDSIFQDGTKFSGCFIDKLNTTELHATTIEADSITTEHLIGRVEFSSLGDNLKQVFKYDPDTNTTIIDGNKIYTGSIYASKIQLDDEITVINDRGDVTFAVQNTGDLTTAGNISSSGVISDNTIDNLGNGFLIKQSGNAKFKNIDINLNGYISTGNAGITNVVGSTNGAVIWAGNSFDNKDKAPFKVDSNGNINANQISSDTVYSNSFKLDDTNYLSTNGLFIGSYGISSNGNITGTTLNIDGVSIENGVIHSSGFDTKTDSTQTSYMSFDGTNLAFFNNNRKSIIYSDTDGRVIFNTNSDKTASGSTYPLISEYDYVFGDFKYESYNSKTTLGSNANILVGGNISARSISILDDSNSFVDSTEDEYYKQRYSIVFKHGCLNIF